MKHKEQIAIRLARLRELDGADRQERPGEILRRWIADPLKPKTKGLDVNPILILLAVMALLMGATFLFFSLV
jgi:hypothetical protein